MCWTHAGAAGGEIKIVKAPIVASACLAIAALCLGALQPAWAEDVPGSSDHPALTRFKGAEIRAYERKDYDEAFMPNQPLSLIHI